MPNTAPPASTRAPLPMIRFSSPRTIPVRETIPNFLTFVKYSIKGIPHRIGHTNPNSGIKMGIYPSIIPAKKMTK